MTSYHALTIWQPWASLILAGAKPYEWRGWAAPRWVIGKRIAIHAGARKVRRDEIKEILLDIEKYGEAGTSLKIDIAQPLLTRWMSAAAELPLRSVLCTAVLGQPITTDQWVANQALDADGVGRAVADSDRIDHSQWAWPLTDIRPIEPFAPANGKQGFWKWDHADG